MWVSQASWLDPHSGGGDVAAVYSDTIGYRIIDALRAAGLTITRRR
jgi:hypothetical protein